MRMELIQPFINAADAVFAESLQAPTKIVDLAMDEETYRRKGIAAFILIKGEIEGRVILDLAPEVALKVASHLAGSAVAESEQVARETVCELANMVIGNSVTLLNDQGFRFKVFPPEMHMNDKGLAGNADTERGARVKAAAAGTDLVLLPELFICGYSPEDLVLKPALQAACRCRRGDAGARYGQ